MSFRKWAARGAVACASAVVVSLGVTSGPATALSVPPPPTPTMILGAARAVAPGMASGMAVCAASLVCAAGAGLLIAGTALYATRDTWVPWVQSIDWFGSSDKPVNLTKPLYIGVPATGPAGNQLQANIFNQSTGAFVGSVDWLVICKTSSGAYLSAQNRYSDIWDPNQVRNLVMSCGTGSVPVWAKLTGPQGDPNTRVQNERVWAAAGESDALAKASTVRVTSKCLKADGTVQDIVMEYPATTVSQGLTVPSCMGAGVGVGAAKSYTADVIMPGSAGARTIWSVAPSANSVYPSCDPTTVAGLCTLEVWVDGSRCLVGDARCVQWAALDPSRVLCRYGPYSVSIAHCNSLERAYRPGGAPATEANTDGDPRTYTKPDGSTGTDGLEEPQPPPNPIPTDPLPPVVTDPGVDPSTGANCWPSGVAAFNPLEWVLRPVQCALVWAFAPSEVAVQEAKDTLTTRIDSVGMGPLVDSLGESFSWVGAGAGCTGPTIEFSLAGQSESIQPFNACADPMRTAAEFSRALSAVIIGISGGLSIVRAIASAFGLNFSMGRSQEAAA